MRRLVPFVCDGGRRSLEEHETYGMSKLVYITNTSVDGYIEDQTAAFDWGDADPLHPLFTQLLQSVGMLLYGRRLYEVMAYWDAPLERYPPEHREFARAWQEPTKLVFSRTLAAVTTRNTRIEREFDVEDIRKLKRDSEHDIAIGGSELAALALDADLIDECHLIVHPLIVGGGKPAFRPGLRRDLELLETRRVAGAIIYAHYRVRGSA